MWLLIFDCISILKLEATTIISYITCISQLVNQGDLDLTVSINVTVITELLVTLSQGRVYAAQHG